MLRRIVSGGQTGVDRAALDAAMTLALDHGGWCPQGRRAEDGMIPAQYQLEETDSPEYPFRTEQNVVDSDATVILFRHRLVGGSALTRKLALRHQRPHQVHDLAESLDPEPLAVWIATHRFGVLNVAGPRESTAPGIQRQAYDFLVQLLTRESS